MAIQLPFTPTTGATAGNTITITTGANTTSVPSTVNNTTQPANNIRVTNGNSVVVFVRVSAEATPVASTADIPLAVGGSILLMNPVTNGKTGIAAVNISGTAGSIYFTPCEGGS